MKFDEQRNMMRLHPSRTDARQGARLSHAHGLCGQDNRPFENDKSVNPFNTKWQGVEFDKRLLRNNELDHELASELEYIRINLQHVTLTTPNTRRYCNTSTATASSMNLQREPPTVSCFLTQVLTPKQQIHPRPDDHLLKGKIICRALTYRTAPPPVLSEPLSIQVVISVRLPRRRSTYIQKTDSNITVSSQKVRVALKSKPNVPAFGISPALCTLRRRTFRLPNFARSSTNERHNSTTGDRRSHEGVKLLISLTSQS